MATALTGLPTDVISTEANNLANNGRCVSAITYSNQGEGGTVWPFLYADAEAYISLAVGAATVNTTVDLYGVPSANGVDFGDGYDGSATPAAVHKLGSFLLAAAQTQRVYLKRLELPVCKGLTFVILNNATGRAFAATGSYVRLTAYMRAG